MRVRFWGVRGTIPTPGPTTARIGGNTACVDVLTSDQQLIILDAGSGIRLLGKALAQEHPQRVVGTLLISHTHWDHIQGFPFFMPAFMRHSRFVVIGQKRIGQQLENVLAGQVVEPYLPFGYQDLEADLIVKEIQDGERMVIGHETVVTAANLNHPGGCLGFRLDNAGVVLAYCTDVSHDGERLDAAVVRLAQGADLLVHDAQYSPAQKARYPHYGHSSWVEAAHAAQAAQARQLALFHHDPDADDAMLQTALLQARAIFPRTFLAREGLVIHLPYLAEALPE